METYRNAVAPTAGPAYSPGVSKLPDRREPKTPDRRLTSEEFELVVRRAAELQSRSPDEQGLEGVSEEEALRIGRELGLSGAHLVRAMAEVRSGPGSESGLAARLMGESRLSAARTVPGEAGALGGVLEAYLTEHEFLVVQRRLSDRTVYVRASGVLAAVARTTTGMFRKSPLLEVENLAVSALQLEPGLAYVAVATDLSGERAGHLAGAGAVGGGVGGVVGVTLGLAVAPAAALVAVPIAAAGLAGMRYGYRGTVRKVEVQLEALLDRLEHGELKRR